MYRVLKHRVLWSDITIADPECEATIKVQYRLMDADEMSAALLRGLDKTVEDGDPRRMAMLRDTLSLASREEADAWLADHIVGWQGLADEDGNPLECTREHLLAVLKIPYIRREIDAGLWAASQGGRRKNS